MIEEGIFLFLGIFLTLWNNVAGDYCSFSCGYNRYCCGHNVCCRYSTFRVWSLWYFWFIVIILLLLAFVFCGYCRKRRMQRQAQNVYSSGTNTVQHIPNAYPNQYVGPTVPGGQMIPPSYNDAIKNGPPTYVAAGGYPVMAPPYQMNPQMPGNMYTQTPAYVQAPGYVHMSAGPQQQ